MLGPLSRDENWEAELVQIGDSFCLFNPRNHALALLDCDSAHIWRQCKKAVDGRVCSPSGLTGEAARKLIAAWREAGFIGSAPYPVESGATNYLPAGMAGDFATYCLSQDRSVSVVCDDEFLGDVLQGILAPLKSEVRGKAVVRISVGHHSRNEFEIWYNSLRMAVCNSVGEARRLALQAILIALYGRDKIAAILHASAIAIAGKGVVLAGATGYGKSTLAARFATRGATYLGDDLIALAPDGTTILAFPIAASIKRGSWERISEDFPQLLASEVFRFGQREVRYLDLLRGSDIGVSGYSVGSIFFPKFGDGFALSCSRLSSEECFAQLVMSGSEVTGKRRSIKPLAQFTNFISAFQINYGNVDDAVDEISAIVNGQ